MILKGVFMKSILVLTATLAMFNLSSARADDEISQPPTDRDARPLSADKPDDAGDKGKDADAGKGKDDAFGQKVKAEVIKLKAEGKNRKGGVGKWVSGQRRQDADHRSDNSHHDSSSDGGTRGTRPATPGDDHSGRH
jgi:hypothetical protein